MAHRLAHKQSPRVLTNAIIEQMEFADLQALIRTTAATLLTAHDIERAALALVGGEKSVQVEGHFNGLTNRCWSAIRPRRRSESSGGAGVPTPSARRGTPPR